MWNKYTVDRSRWNGWKMSKGIHMYSVGEICMEFHLTRKTLYHYDKEGLLKPTVRVGSQEFKEYDEEAVERLRKILLFKEAGLHLEEIRLLLDHPENDPMEVFRNVSNRLQKEHDKAEKKIEKLHELMQVYLEKEDLSL